MEYHEYQPSSTHCGGGKHYFCLQCGECKTFGCEFHGENHKKKFETYKTQKAKGLALINSDFVVFQNLQDTIKNQASYEEMRKLYGDKLFARPCPVLPCHGFVDSRIVESYEDLLQVFTETIAADPEGEVVLMPYYKAKYNAVYANGTVTVGLGNDGATSGKNCVVIPTAVSLPIYPDNEDMKKTLLESASITDAPYVESVFHKNHWTLTQLRNGPFIPSSSVKDFIPEEVKVKEVIIPVEDGNLLAWELKCKELAGKDGLVVWQQGASVTCHFGVHCYLNNIPYITTFEPHVGDTLRFTVKKEETDYNAFFDGVIRGLDYEIEQENYQSIMCCVLAGLHNTMYFTGENTKFVGAAVALLIRLGIAACMGEARHYNAEKRIIKEDQRNVVYEKSFSKFEDSLNKINIVRLIFKYGVWSSSYGGKKWEDCTNQTMLLWNNVCRLYRRRTEANFVRLISQFNTVVNCAHNNGWWLNKFCHKELFDNASVCASYPVMYGANVFYDIAKMQPKRIVENRIFMPVIKKAMKEDNKLFVLSIKSNKYSSENGERCPDCGHYHD